MCTGRDLGLPLHRMREVLDGDEHRWREHVRTQLAELDAQAERIADARNLLTRALECDRPHPPTDCPQLLATLDRAVDGT